MSITQGALYDRFDLEESIQQLGQISDDVKLLSENVMENPDIDIDGIVNTLIGLESIHNMRFDKCIEVLEYVIGTKILDNKNYDHPDKPEKDPMGYPINKWDETESFQDF